MVRLVLGLWSLTAAVPDARAANAPGYLFRMVPGPDHAMSLQGEPYLPREGDVVLFDDHNKFMHFLYRIRGTGGPLHSAFVFKRPDGTLAVLEAGPNFTPKVFVLEVAPRLHDFYGTILIRRLKHPLATEQSEHLTQFALAQEGKHYALARLALQATPFRPRGPLRTTCLGRTCMDRKRWMCSELTVAAVTATGLCGKKYCANGMYPRDLCYDETYDFSSFYEDPALWYPLAHLEMEGNGIVLFDGRSEETKKR
jgi:hypothetical protein